NRLHELDQPESRLVRSGEPDYDRELGEPAGEQSVVAARRSTRERGVSNWSGTQCGGGGLQHAGVRELQRRKRRQLPTYGKQSVQGYGERRQGSGSRH